MKVNTGKGTISLMIVIAIWSLSLGINLPGLAVTPMLDKLGKIFGNVSELEIQLLTMMPNILIIPFLIIAGRLSITSKHKIGIVMTALGIFLSAGVLYFFCRSMTALILVSALLGIGCGLLIPFSTGLIADVFVGKYRMQQMGIISAIGNFSLVIATFVVGILAGDNWHLPFCVYLIPAICVILSPWLFKIPEADLYHKAPVTATTPAEATKAEAANDKIWHGFYVRRSAGLLGVYFFYVFCFASITYYLSYLMDSYHMGTEETGDVTSVLFLAMSMGGMCLAFILRSFKGNTFIAASISMVIGFLFFLLTHDFILMCIGAAFAGVGVGVIQPIMFDKATETVARESLSTMALAVTLAANYASISVTPLIISAAEGIFGHHGAQFPFIVNIVLVVAMTVVVVFCRKAFPFSISKSSY